MKAYSIQKAWNVTSIEIPEPVFGPTEVLLEVHFLGLCGSDLNSFRGYMPLVKYPIIPGHEISGVIVNKGSKVPDSMKIGDQACILPYIHCGVCPACRKGRINACEFNQTLGVQRDGALTERIVVHYDKIFINNKLSLQELALVEPMSVGYHAINRIDVKENDLIAILGCGTIGLGALCAAVAKGAIVIAIDISESKLKQALKFGATHIVNSSHQNLKEEIRKLTNNEGVSMVIEAAGSASTFQSAFEIVSFAGNIAAIGYLKDEVSFNAQNIVRKELNIYGSRNALNVFPAVINMFEQREKSYDELITKIFPFEKSSDAFIYWNDHQETVSKILIEVKPKSA